jgi:capsular exopolysaccharide synthesis family protein
MNHHPTSQSEANDVDTSYSDYSYGSYASDAIGNAKSLRSYFLIFKERFWFFATALFICLNAALLILFNQVPVYRAAATIQILREDPEVIESVATEANEIRSTEDFNTQLSIIRSYSILKNVAARLKGEDLRQFLEPYLKDDVTNVPIVEDILLRNRIVEPQRLSYVISISYIHPNAEIAAKVANLIAEEAIGKSLDQTIAFSNQAVVNLRAQADEQRRKVEALETKLSEYRENLSSISIDAGENILIQEVNKLNDISINLKSEYDLARIKVDEMDRATASGRALWELPFISHNPRVSLLLSKVSDSKIELASLEQRYRDKHPQLIRARESLSEAEKELAVAVDNAAEEIVAHSRQTQRNHEQAVERLKGKEADLLQLSKQRVGYNSILTDLEVERSFYEAIVSHMAHEMAQSQMKTAQYRFVDYATAPPQPFKPSWILYTGMGICIGIASGIGLVVLLACLDDRVKTSEDIEDQLGLPLLSILPHLDLQDRSELSTAVASKRDRTLTEAFRTALSTIRVSDLGREAKVILTTSTVPGEGKSFVSSNLSATMANHGERTILIDCDLRLPTVRTSLKLENEKGLSDYIMEEDPDADYGQYVTKDVLSKLDVMTAGSRISNATEYLTHPQFKKLVMKLRDDYDRIILDTPPLAAVSDALTIVPLTDAVIYVVKFNSIKKRSAAFNIKRLRDANRPILGAIINDIDTNWGRSLFAGYTEAYTAYSYYHLDDDEVIKLNPQEGEAVDAKSAHA